MTKRADVELAVKTMIRKLGRIDILVNKVGASGRTPIHDGSLTTKDVSSKNHPSWEGLACQVIGVLYRPAWNFRVH